MLSIKHKAVPQTEKLNYSEIGFLTSVPTHLLQVLVEMRQSKKHLQKHYKSLIAITWENVCPNLCIFECSSTAYQ